MRSPTWPPRPPSATPSTKTPWSDRWSALAHRDRVERYTSHGKASDARLTTGGGRPAAHPHGWFIEPTAFADVDLRDLLAGEEVSGPVLTPQTDEREARRLANESDFGLSDPIFTAHPDKGLTRARQIQTGTIGTVTSPTSPHRSAASNTADLAAKSATTASPSAAKPMHDEALSSGRPRASPSFCS
jgi:hypothetical protein